MKLRRLTAAGIEGFSTYLSQLRMEASLAPPTWLLDDPESSEAAANVEVPQREFENRLAVAEHLDALIADAGLQGVESDAGLWSWLTLFYFDEVCPRGENSKRKVFKEQLRYIPALHNYQKYFRHLLYGPYVLLQRYRNALPQAMSLLTGPVHTSNDIVEQIASRLELVSNPTIVATATELYIDKSTGQFKYGAKGTGKGSPRRLHAVIEQFDVTFDLAGMSQNDLMQLLPAEFDRFRK